MRKRNLLIIGIVSFTILVLGYLGAESIMNRPENISHCRFFTEFSGDSFESHWESFKAPIPELGKQPTVDLEFNILLPFKPSENDIFIVDVAAGAEPHDFTLYKGQADRELGITVRFPLRGEWPDGGYFSFTLVMPDKKAICVWGGEEEILLENSDHPRHFKIELLPDVYIDEATGARRRTIITPFQ